jgi:phage gp29-like protein
MALLDAYGRPIVFEALREEQAAPTLLGIRNIYSIIDDSIGLTPEKAAGILRTAEYGDPWLYLELAERMEEKDLLYQGVLHTRKMAVSQLDIDVQAAGDDRQSLQDSEFIRDILIDSSQVDLHDVVFEMLDSLGKGFSATEGFLGLAAHPDELQDSQRRRRANRDSAGDVTLGAVQVHHAYHTR